MKKYENASIYGCYVTLCPWLRFGRELKGCRRPWRAWDKVGPHGVFCDLRQKALWVASGNGDGRAEKPRYDVPQGVGVKNRYEA